MARTDQVDSKVPRAKAAFHTLLPASGFLLDSVADPAGKIVVVATGLAMALSVAGGPRASLFGRLYTKVIRPALKSAPGRLEDAAPHRFAETLGALFLLGAGVAFAAGAEAAGWVLALLVAALAALNWLGGLCIGCQMYLLIKRIQAA